MLNSSTVKLFNIDLIRNTEKCLIANAALKKRKQEYYENAFYDNFIQDESKMIICWSRNYILELFYFYQMYEKLIFFLSIPGYKK